MAGREGSVVGPYRLTRLLGSGGAGDVYLGEGPAQGGRPGLAAVKVLRGEAGDATAMAILREAQSIAQAQQSHVLPIYDAGQQGAILYIAMAYAAGGSLGSTIDASSADPVRLPLGAGVVARLVNQVARALTPLHARGAVHGDLKPNNLFVRTARQGGPMAAVADFGQAVVPRAAAQAAHSGATWAAAALLCAAPEQLRGEPTAASDQYALAVIAYLLLTGRYPFIGDAQSLTQAILTAQPDSPSRLDPAVGPEVERALLRALAKSPGARFSDIAAFALALDDGLAASRGAMSGITQEFSALGGVARAADSPPPPAGARGAVTPIPRPESSTANGRLQATFQVGGVSHNIPAAGRAGGTGALRGAPTALGVPRRRGLTSRQRLAALLGGVAILALAAAGVFGLTLLFNGAGAAGQLPNFGGLNYAPTVTPNATALAKSAAMSHAAEAQLASVMSGRPAFADSLSANAQHWAVDNTDTFFASDGRLHLYNHNVHAVLSLDQPVAAPADFAVSVSLTFLHGSISDLAGLRVRVVPVGDGRFAHVTVLISPDGRYEIWHYSGTNWSVLDFGYTQAIQRGLGETNVLAILAQGSVIQVFVNQHYLTTVADVDNATASDTTLGPTVIYAGTEVAYSHYAVYAVGG